jgi:GPH family glycoside/pentoside/hexuronide:cation symporter
VSERLSRRTKLSYGVGDIGLSLTSTVIGAYFALFLTDVVGLSPRIAAAAIFIGRSWDYINDPLVGHISDRTRTRWGRRRPFLLFGALPFALGFALLWWRPPISSQIGLGAYYALAYLLYEAAATLIYMPYSALTPELTLDYDERTALTSYRMFFSILASLVAFTVPIAFVGRFVPGNAARVLIMGAGCGLISALPFLLTFAGTREREAFREQATPSIVASLKAAAKNRPFVFGMAIYLLTWVAVKLLEAMLLYFIKYGIEREGQSDWIMLTIFAVAMAALPLWEWASRHWNKRWAYVTGIAFWAVVQIVIVTLTPATGLPLIFMLCALAGIGVSVAHVIPFSMIPDAVEWDELQTGQRHEGVFYGLVTLAQKVATSLALPAALLLLDVTGYVPNAAQQSPSALIGIRLLTGPIPAVLLCAGILFALVYPLDRAQHLEVRRALEARRAAQLEEIT